MKPFFELRIYKVFSGKMDTWIALMEQVIIPFQVSKGMVICGSFAGEEDESVYVWLRRFDSEEQRKELYAAVYRLCFNALRVLHRTWTGSWRRRATMTPSSRHGHAMPEAAVEGTRA